MDSLIFLFLRSLLHHIVVYHLKYKIFIAVSHELVSQAPHSLVGRIILFRDYFVAFWFYSRGEIRGFMFLCIFPLTL